MVEKIKRVLLQGPKGPLTDMGQAALDKVWHGANAFLAKQSPKMFTTGADVPVGPGAISRQEMRKLLKAHGMPNWTGWIALAESGLNPHATSSADARGLFQILESVWGGGDRLYDPNYNVAKARQVLTQQGISAWAPSEHGGFLPEGWGPHVGQPFRKGGMVMPPFGGSFGNGGTVPGPIGAPRTIVAHGGESVGPPEVHLHFKPGTEWLRDFVQVEVEDGLNGQTRLHRQKARMRR